MKKTWIGSNDINRVGAEIGDNVVQSIAKFVVWEYSHCLTHNVKIGADP